MKSISNIRVWPRSNVAVSQSRFQDRRTYNGSVGRDAIFKRKLAEMQGTLCHVICNYDGHVMAVGDRRAGDGGDGRVLYTPRRTFQLPTCITSRCAFHAWNAVIERRRTAFNLSEIADHDYHHHHQTTPSSLLTSSRPPYSLTFMWNEH